MALEPSDFTEPKGELRADMFPGVDDLEVEGGHVATWLSEAQEKASGENSPDETAKKHWVYHRAYKAIWLRLTTNPRQADLDEDGSLRYSDEQVAAFKELADQNRESFEKIAGETDEVQGRELRSQTRSSTTRLV
ncbi:hypothetical protein [Salinibacter altiplanensis]|uniref:hypothetical protein n=1 Tax=Salinibacter altiplanensis TaxID=1803181 RepID=UPI000C9FCD8F|nr:hypothetical protein [Salinibacter altiplanensis]